MNTNWGKRSIALDFDDEGDRDTLRRLIATADVLVENFRPAVMPKLGFGADSLLEEHPELIYAAIRGFPSTSDLANAPAYDHVIQAMTGFGGNQADLKTGVPVLVQQAVVDKVTGLTAAQAITAASFERDPHRSRTDDRDPDAACRPRLPLARRRHEHHDARRLREASIAVAQPSA